MRRHLTIASAAFAIVIGALIGLHVVGHQRWSSSIGLSVFFAAGIGFVLCCVAVFPRLLVRGQDLDGPDRAKAENDTRGTLIQAVGGVVLLAGVYMTWSQLSATQQQVVIAGKQQINDQFSRSVDQLGQGNQDIRIGGIYALARLGQDTEEERYPVLDILSSYIREHSPRTGNEPKDAASLAPLRLRSPDVEIALIQVAAMHRDPPATVLLDHTNLIGAELGGLDLSWVTLSHSDLRKIQFPNANLSHASLDDADMRGAEFDNANLSDVVAIDADMRGVSLPNTVKLRGAHFQGVNLAGAIIAASLEGADLNGAIVCGADLTRADVNHTKEGSFLIADKNTRWPKGFDLSTSKGHARIEMLTPNSWSPSGLDLSSCSQG